MQAKTDENLNKPNFPIWVGIDVSKNSFTAACRSILPDWGVRFPSREKFSFSKKDVREFLGWVKSLAPFDFGIAMEVTGVYSEQLSRVIHEVAPEQHVALCNANSVSMYARSYTDEKSDKADAARIAGYALDRQPVAPRPRGEAESKLREIGRERNRLVVAKNALENALESLGDREVVKIHRKAIAALNKSIEQLESLIEQVVNSDEAIRKEVDLMTTVPGVGFLSAACIFAELGSLKNYTRKQVSALSGVCPVNRLSGTSVNRHSMSHKGSKVLRKFLYLDSHQAIRFIPALAEFHERMLAKPNSSRMKAKCAAMRKLLLILHALVVNDRPFDPNYKSEPPFKKNDFPA